jgi:hypothetical protein
MKSSDGKLWLWTMVPLTTSSQRWENRTLGGATPVKTPHTLAECGKRLAHVENEGLSTPVCREESSRTIEALMISPIIETSETSERCRVLLRIRPLPESDGRSSPLVIVEGSRVEVKQRDGSDGHESFSVPFDHLFEQDSTQVKTKFPMALILQPDKATREDALTAEALPTAA